MARLPPTYDQTAGFVYLLSNPSMPNIVKIGSTERTLKDRLTELSSTTGVPTPFVIEYYLMVENPYDIEIALHDELSEFRVSNNREFFNISKDKAIEKFQKIQMEFMIGEVTCWEEEIIGKFHSELIWHITQQSVMENSAEILEKLKEMPETVLVKILEDLFREKPQVWRELK